MNDAIGAITHERIPPDRITGRIRLELRYNENIPAIERIQATWIGGDEIAIMAEFMEEVEAGNVLGVTRDGLHMNIHQFEIQLIAYDPTRQIYLARRVQDKRNTKEVQQVR